MARRDAVLAFAAILAVAGCGSSLKPAAVKPVGAVATAGLGVAAAAINRAVAGECWGYCRLGTVCDKASGLCVEAGSKQGAVASSAPPTPHGSALPEGHEYEIPPLPSSTPGAGCVAAAGDAGTPDCRPNASAP